MATNEGDEDEGDEGDEGQGSKGRPRPTVARQSRTPRIGDGRGMSLNSDRPDAILQVSLFRA